MKAKQLLFTALFLIASSVASAQFEAGVKAGFGAHWLPGTALDGTEAIRPHNGYYGGVFAEYTIDDTFIIQAEALYASKGHSDKSVNGKYSRDLRYINIPLYFGYRLTRNISIMAGPEIGLLTGCTVIRDGEKTKGKEGLNSFDAGIALQFSLAFSERVGLNLNGNYSFTRFADDKYLPEGAFEPVVDKGHNAGMQLGIYYKLVIE